jgi:hypothetical protein
MPVLNLCRREHTRNAGGRGAGNTRCYAASAEPTSPGRPEPRRSSGPIPACPTSSHVTSGSCGHAEVSWYAIPCAPCADERRPPSSTTSSPIVAFPRCSGISPTGKDCVDIVTASRQPAKFGAVVPRLGPTPSPRLATPSRFHDERRPFELESEPADRAHIATGAVCRIGAAVCFQPPPPRFAAHAAVGRGGAKTFCEHGGISREFDFSTRWLGSGGGSAA